MICPKCGNEFIPKTKNGYTPKFCSRSCANSRNHTDATKSAISKKLRGHVASPEVKQYCKERLITALKERALYKIENEKFENLSFPLKWRKIFDEQLGKCAICGIPPEWNGNKLRFEVDHINGDRKNESRENLRLLCPNCHSQTETFSGNSSGKVSNDELLDALRSSETLHQAFRKVGLMPDRNAYQRARRLLLK